MLKLMTERLGEKRLNKYCLLWDEKPGQNISHDFWNKVLELDQSRTAWSQISTKDFLFYVKPTVSVSFEVTFDYF